MARSRTRSRSPPRSNKPSQRAGFRWKDKPKREGEPDSSRGPERGYRHERDESYRQRDDGRDRTRDTGRDKQRGNDEMRGRDDRKENDRDESDKPRRRSRERRRLRSRERGSNPSTPIDAEIASKFGPSSTSLSQANQSTGTNKVSSTASAPLPTAPPPPPPPRSNEPMILVTVNDRLGTKAQIPCLASDPVRLFKAQVAARIGRQSHEIMLKRQGERPFKDQLTLEDYGVSSGVQLDLEVDTGD